MSLDFFKFKTAEHIFVAVAKLFTISNFKEFQKKAIKSLLDGNDVFVGQPTGSGKSLVYLSLPFLYGKVVETTGDWNCCCGCPKFFFALC